MVKKQFWMVVICLSVCVLCGLCALVGAKFTQQPPRTADEEYLYHARQALQIGDELNDLENKALKLRVRLELHRRAAEKAGEEHQAACDVVNGTDTAPLRVKLREKRASMRESTERAYGGGDVKHMVTQPAKMPRAD